MAATVNLDTVYVVTAKGRTYHYAWRGKGAPRLKAEPGSEAYVAELAAALAERGAPDTTRISGLCHLWRLSDAWTQPRERGGMAETTRKNWRPFLDAIQDHFGPLRLAQFERAKAIRPEIRKFQDRWKDRPRQADMAKQVLSALLTFAVDQDLLTANPCLGLKNRYKSDRADRIWTPEDLDRLARTAPEPVILAARLAALTGLRQSDLLRLSWSHVGALAIEIPASKSGRRSAPKRSALIPIYGELRQLLDSLPRRSPVILTNSEGRPWRTGFTSSWNKTLIKAGMKDADLHFHDLRGTAATRMRLGGLETPEIAEILAWSEEDVDRLIRRYISRDTLLRDRIARLDQNTPRTDSAKPTAKPVP